MTRQSDDRQRLLSNARGGDDDALGQLIENHRPMLRAHAMQSLAQVQGRIDASDVVQMTLWSAFRAFPKFEGDVDGFVGWLCKIHDRNLHDAVRDQHAEKRSIKREVSGSTALPLAIVKATSPSQRLQKLEQQELLNQHVESLPMAQREAVRLRYCDGMTIAEIVVRLGRSDTAVAGLLKRGLSKLRELMSNTE